MMHAFESAPLEELVTITGGGTPSKTHPEYYVGPIPWVTPKDMKTWEISDSQDRISETAIASSAAKIIEPNAVLIVIRSGVLKHSLPVAINRVPIAINQDLKALRCGTKLLPEFLARTLQWAAPGILQTVRGTTADNISMDVIKRLQVPLPPLPEQRRIAAILDKADAIRHKRQEAIRLTEELLRSTFLEMFGDPVTNPKGWREERLDAVADIRSGVTKGRRLNPSETVLVPYLRVANVQDGRIDTGDVKDIEVLRSEVNKYKLIPGDVLLTEGGDPDKLGRGSVWQGHIDPCVHQNHIFRVRPNTNFVLPEYLSAQIGSTRGKRYFLRAAKQTTGIASINSTQLRAFPVLLPPLESQVRFTETTSRISALGDVSCQRWKSGEALFGSLVQRAFRGRL